jgi:hypothetical protein
LPLDNFIFFAIIIVANAQYLSKCSKKFS